MFLINPLKKTMKIMKKAYINPETSIVLVTVQHIIATSNPEGFNGQLDNENTIETNEMLSRRKPDIWEEEEEEDDMAW